MIGALRQQAASRLIINEFSLRLEEYQRWRSEIIEFINEYRAWAETHGLASSDQDFQLFELIDALRAEKLTIALVGEFSRGKTELINAIFFADHRQRLLPSEAGRTTMCPTELRYDADEPPCIKLLPIETRKTATTIASYRRTPAAWTVLPLALDSPKKMAETFRQITRTKPVSADLAEALGFYCPKAVDSLPLNSDGTVEIPVWRHIVINYPHPLLKQGLVVLDTPGLNALGAEPELTLSMLPDAQALLFVLAADAGVSKTDLAIWKNHISSVKGNQTDGRMVVLNKIDALWDELSNEAEIHAAITRQIEETARTLGIPAHQVTAVSARKGLLGKIKLDQRLLGYSGLPTLEARLSNDIIPARQALLRESVVLRIGSLVETTNAMIAARINALTRQIEELRAYGDDARRAPQDFSAQLRHEKQRHYQTVVGFQSMRIVLSDQIKILLDHLRVDSFDALAEKTRQDMAGSWTTPGLREGMKTLFDAAHEAMEKAHAQTQEIAELADAIYKQFHREHGLARIVPARFSLLPCRARLHELYEEAERFRNSPLMIITEQHFVVRKFFDTLAGQARELFGECSAAARAWSRAITAPILPQVREHSLLMEQRFENLRRIHENADNLNARIANLESQRQDMANQQLVIRHMLRKINQPLPRDS